MVPGPGLAGSRGPGAETEGPWAAEGGRSAAGSPDAAAETRGAAAVPVPVRSGGRAVAGSPGGGLGVAELPPTSRPEYGTDTGKVDPETEVWTEDQVGSWLTREFKPAEQEKSKFRSKKKKGGPCTDRAAAISQSNRVALCEGPGSCLITSISSYVKWKEDYSWDFWERGREFPEPEVPPPFELRVVTCRGCHGVCKLSRCWWEFLSVVSRVSRAARVTAGYHLGSGWFWLAPPPPPVLSETLVWVL